MVTVRVQAAHDISTAKLKNRQYQHFIKFKPCQIFKLYSIESRKLSKSCANCAVVCAVELAIRNTSGCNTFNPH